MPTTLPVMQGLHTEVYELPNMCKTLKYKFYCFPLTYALLFHCHSLHSSPNHLTHRCASSEIIFSEFPWQGWFQNIYICVCIYLASQIYFIAESVDLSCKLIITWKSEAHECSATAFQYKSAQLQGSCHTFSTSVSDAVHDPVYLLTV